MKLKTYGMQIQEDLYYPHPLIQDMLWGFLYHVGERFLNYWPFSMLRRKALEIAINHVHYEDENSRYLCIGSVEKVINYLYEIVLLYYLFILFIAR